MQFWSAWLHVPFLSRKGSSHSWIGFVQILRIIGNHGPLQTLPSCVCMTASLAVPAALTCFYRWKNTLPLWQMHCGTLSQTNLLSQSCFVCFPCQATLENGPRPHGMWDSWPYSRFPSTRAWVGKEDPWPHEREFRWQGWVPQLIPTAVPLKAFLCEPEG